MRYTLGIAEKVTGKNKTTIQRAIKSGRLSAERNEDGSYSIDPAELSRVYPLLHLDSYEKGSTQQLATASDGPTQCEGTAVLEERLRNREAEIKKLEQQLIDTREQRDKWQEEAKQWRLLLSTQPGEHGQQVSATPATVEKNQSKPKEKRGFFSWLSGGVTT